MYVSKSKAELYKRERYYIENTACINKVIPGRTHNESVKAYEDTHKESRKLYYTKNKDKLNTYQKKYDTVNKDKINTRRCLN
jgi:hypothetical protein